MATNNLLASYFPDLDPISGEVKGYRSTTPDFATTPGWGYAPAENPQMQGYAFRGWDRKTEGPGSIDTLYNDAGTAIGTRKRKIPSAFDKFMNSDLLPLAMILGPFAATAAGVGAAGAGELAGGAGGFVGEGAASGIPAWDAALGSSLPAELAGSAGATQLAGGAAGDTLESSVPGVFNPAADSQLANEAIQAAGGDALSGYTAAGIPSVTVNGAPTAGGLSGLGSGISSLFGHSGTNTIGDAAGGFNWGSLIGPSLSAIGGVAGANAATDAARIQAEAADKAAARIEPFLKGGELGMNRLLDLLGVSGNTGAEGYGSQARQFGASDFQADPGYAFRQSEGEKGLQRAASASGGLGSGKYLKDAMTFNSGLASQEYGNAFNRFQTNRASVLNPLQSLMGAGQTAANTIGEYGTQGANAQAAGKIGQANALTGAIGQGLSMYQNNQQADQNRLFQNALMNRWTNGG